MLPLPYIVRLLNPMGRAKKKWAAGRGIMLLTAVFPLLTPAASYMLRDRDRGCTSSFLLAPPA